MLKAFTNDTIISKPVHHMNPNQVNIENDSAREEERIFHENLKKDKCEDAKNIFLNRKLVRQTNISNGEIILMCMLLGVRHSLTWLAMMDILNLINKLFDEDILELSKFKLINYFPDKKEWFKYHIHCEQCKYYIGERSNLPEPLTCPVCKTVIENVNNAPYFLTLNVNRQLRELFEDPLVQPHLKYKQVRQKQNVNNIEDIYDGRLYKYLASPGQILNDNLNFSYIFNTDGCQASNSSTTTVWPVYMKIVELPPEIRNKHLILAGLWVNVIKPTMNTFL